MSVEELTEVVATFPVVYMAPKVLKPYFRNAKKHSRAQVTSLANAIRRVGFDQPIVVDKDMVIIKGHGRQLAAIDCGLTLVPVVVRNDLTEMQVMAARIADNESHTRSAVDTQKERVEIDLYVAEGGQYGKEFFDFMSAAPAPAQAPAAKAGVVKKEVSLSGSLQNCPKCSHSFQEVK